MRAYDESYLHDAMETMGDMMDYAVVDCGYDLDEFFGWFIVSGVAAGFEAGNPKFIAGLSGVELACEVVFRITGKRCAVEPTQPLDRSREYWTGWVMAYYQWLRCVRFSDMTEGGLLPSVVIARYLYHEADVSKFVEFADWVLSGSSETPTRLALARKRLALTQRELADAAEVSVRMIQLYEQRQNDLSKASVAVVLRLAKALHCSVEDLLEAPVAGVVATA